MGTGDYVFTAAKQGLDIWKEYRCNVTRERECQLRCFGFLENSEKILRYLSRSL